MEKHKHDRNYYRTMSDRELLEEARRGAHVNWHELAIVLAERLETRCVAWRSHDDD
jgi:hypothetical protein